MLFHVRMMVRLPADLPLAVSERLKTEERARAWDLQRDGRWVHLWRVVGRYENYSIFNVASNDELHELLSTLPLFPYMEIEVTPLATHPSDLRASIKQEL
ncbi:MAG: muconolactone Delta-isomerase [Bacteroidota bacterium]